MLIETKQIILLNAKEQEAFDTVRNMMLVLLSKINDPKLESTVKQICDGLKEVNHIIEDTYQYEEREETDAIV